MPMIVDFERMHLAAVCAELHQHHTGSSDGLGDDEYRAAMARVKRALEYWTRPDAFVGPYDAAVYSMLCAVVLESKIRADERPVLDNGKERLVGKAIGSPPIE